MSLPAAYIGVILIWSTTPLAVKWSGEGPGFLFGVAARMVIGTVLCLLLARILRVRLPWHREALCAYAAAGIGVYGAMLSVYWAAQFIPSGLISVLFGLAPIVTGVMASLWLGERSLTPVKVSGSLIGLAGLALIFGGGGAAGPQAVLGIAGMVASVCLHSLSAVWVKRIGAQVHAVAMTSGALLFALPCYLATWWLMDGQWPESVPQRAWLSIVYLGVCGSGIGFILYYYTLGRVEAARLALITLITPVNALLIGNLLNGETFGPRELAGAGLILSGLLFYELGERLVLTLRRRKAGAPARD